MSEIEINKSRDVLKLFEDRLTAAIATLNQADQIGLERLTTLDGYILTHPRGVYGLLFEGDDYNKKPEIKSNTINMKRDLVIGVVSIIRYIDQPKVPLSKIPDQIMMPFEYTEFARDTLTGIEVWNCRPENERKIYPGKTTLVDEADGIWKYLTPFYIPLDYNKA